MIKHFLLALLLLLPLGSYADAEQELQAFIKEMSSKHGFDEQSLHKAFASTKVSQSILKAMSRPAEKLEWYQYRPIFLKQARIDAGVKFWQEHKQVLEKAEQEFGVPAEIIIAIIGVETRFGQYKGKYRVLDALMTLGFHYPKRAKFFKSELEQFLLLAREQNIDPLSIYGSYAGAMGIPQFISSSYRHYAIDFDNDGKIDLWNNINDAIGSVANYFVEHGWKQGEEVVKTANVSGDAYQAILEKGYKPHTSYASMKDANITTLESLDENETVSLIELKQKNSNDYWLVLKNFYAITRYNHSPLYAMAVYQLSQEIKQAYQQ